jgi:hypothetical protein
MYPDHAQPFVSAGRVALLTGLFLFLAVAAQAQPADPADELLVGRLDFSGANLPAATVELDLSQGMFRDLFGIGDAAAAGLAESLLKSAGADRAAEGTRLAAEKLVAAREILQLARDVVREVRVRVYEESPGEPDASARFERLVSHFDGQLRAGNWETVLRVRKSGNHARVSLLRRNGTIHGVFIVAAEGGDLVLANIVGEVTPENVKKLSAAAASIGLEVGLKDAIEHEMRPLRRRLNGAEGRSTSDASATGARTDRNN